MFLMHEGLQSEISTLKHCGSMKITRRNLFLNFCILALGLGHRTMPPVSVRVRVMVRVSVSVSFSFTEID